MKTEHLILILLTLLFITWIIGLIVVKLRELPPKPIFTAGLPEKYRESSSTAEKTLQRRMPDYHVILYIHGGEEINQQVYYEKDFNNVKFDELKQILDNSLNSLAD